MSYRYEFVAEAVDGHIILPDDIASRLRHKGLSKVRIIMTTIADDEDALLLRGIDEPTIERIASIQKFDRDIAVTALLAEGAAASTELAGRLARLLDEQIGRSE